MAASRLGVVGGLVSVGVLAPTLAGCGEGEVGEARVTWVSPMPGGEERTRRVTSWAFSGHEGSRFRKEEDAGRLLHVDVPLPAGAHGQLQLDLPLEDRDQPISGRYVEHRDGALVFDGQLLAGGLVHRESAGLDCGCLAGAFSLSFRDPGPDGRPNTPDDLQRELRDGYYHVAGGSCAVPEPPTPDGSGDGVAFVLDRYCGGSAGAGAPPPGERAGDGSRRNWDGPRDRDWDTDGDTVVVVYQPTTYYPPPADNSGCGSGCGSSSRAASSGGGCEGENDDGGCGSDDGGGGCEGDNDGGGCDGDDGGGCDGDDGGCDGDDRAQGRAGGPCQLRRPGLPRSLQSCLFIAAAVAFAGGRERRSRGGPGRAK